MGTSKHWHNSKDIPRHAPFDRAQYIGWVQGSYAHSACNTWIQLQLAFAFAAADADALAASCTTASAKAKIPIDLRDGVNDTQERLRLCCTAL